eukprot:TRINITY_DN8761_c0_g1_i1.p1 TRINITY_DN8761_c0_g1~~TRINITY_DN8761_c0_g1_i1.p1  ORF type:complete len:713 (-),score=132.13 TRINITY_DN8761_c0_g1_i1:123-2261(-)
MPVIKAQFIPAAVAAKEKAKKSRANEQVLCEMSEGEYTRKDLQHDIHKVLKSSILPEMRKLCEHLRQDVREDLKAALQTPGLALEGETDQSSPAGFNSRLAAQDIFVPPRAVTAPASQKSPVHHPHAVVDHFPGHHSSDEELVDEDSSENHQPGDSSLRGSWVAEAWGSNFADGSADTPRKQETQVTSGKEVRCSFCGNIFLSDASYCRKCGQKRLEVDAGKPKLSRRVTALRKQEFEDECDLIAEVLQTEDVSCFQTIVNHDYFDYIMSALLLTNATMMGVQVEILATQGDPVNPPSSFRVIDVAFCVIFIAELFVRWFAFGPRKFYFGPEWQWGWFDTIIVGFSAAEESFKLIQPSGSEGGIFSNFGFLRMLRIGRIVRLVRVVRLIPALKSMVYLISASMQSFLWTVVLILIMMYCFAVYFTELATDIVCDQGASLTDDQKDEIKKSWGSLIPSVMSLFQAITGGDDWHNFVVIFKPVSNEVYNQNLIIFSLYIAFASLVMMNLVTGVFVEGAQRIAREEKNQELQKHVRKIVSLATFDIDEPVSYDQFSELLDRQEFQAYLKAFDMDQNAARNVFYILDVTQSGAISMKDFFSACIHLQGGINKGDTEILRHRLMHSFADMLKSLDAIEKVVRRKYATAPGDSSFREQSRSPPKPSAMQPVSPKCRVPELEKPQTPLPFPLPDNLSGYLLKTGSNKHMVTWIGPQAAS